MTMAIGLRGSLSRRSRVIGRLPALNQSARAFTRHWASPYSPGVTSKWKTAPHRLKDELFTEVPLRLKQVLGRLQRFSIEWTGSAAVAQTVSLRGLLKGSPDKTDELESYLTASTKPPLRKGSTYEGEFKNPTSGSWWIVQTQPTTLPRALHPTSGSWWIIQAQPLVASL